MQPYVHKEISPFHYRKGYYFTKKRYSKGNVVPYSSLTQMELTIAKLVGFYGVITRPQIEAALGKTNLYKHLKDLCDKGICNSYEKTAEDKTPLPLIFYCINTNKQTNKLIREDKMSFSQEHIHKETAAILSYLSLMQWHMNFQRDYRKNITAEELTECCSMIRCKGKKTQHFVTFRFSPEKTDDFYSEVEKKLKEYKQKHPLTKRIYAVIICDATAGELKISKKINQLAKTPLIYTTDLHIEKGNVLDWLFLYEDPGSDNETMVRKRMAVQL